MRYRALSALLFLVPAGASAASLASTPATMAVSAGQSFTLALTADPASSTIVSIRVHLVFDPAILHEESFTLAPGWLALSEPGYDSVNDKRGSVTKTAGYPHGFNRPTAFATVTFKAEAAGTSSVIVAGDTLMLDSTAENRFGGRANGTFVVVQSVAAHVRGWITRLALR